MNQNASLDEKLISDALRIVESEYEQFSDFNDSFDDDPVVLAGREYKKSRALYWLDPPLYIEAKGEWESQEMQEKHYDALRCLKGNSHENSFRELVEAIRLKRIVPFVGAGISKPMNLPLWDDALRALCARINPGDENILNDIGEGRLIEAAQKLSDCDEVRTKNFIRTTYKIAKIKGPVHLLPRISAGCIITTNFDDAIEEVFKSHSIAFDGYLHGMQQHNYFARLVRGQRCLLKLHGDVDDQNSYILTQQQYNDAYGEPLDFKLPLPKALRQLYVSSSLLFLGCSLEQDMTLNIFEHVFSKGEYEVPMHYAVLPEPSSEYEKNHKESRLVGLNIQPIWYPSDKHEYVEGFLSLAVDLAENRLSISELGHK